MSSHYASLRIRLPSSLQVPVLSESNNIEHPFIIPLVRSPLMQWAAHLVVTPVNCPTDDSPAAPAFVNREDVILEMHATSTPIDKPGK